MQTIKGLYIECRSVGCRIVSRAHVLCFSSALRRLLRRLVIERLVINNSQLKISIPKQSRKVKKSFLLMLQVSALKKELQYEREEKVLQTNKAAVKSDEIREVRHSLGKSLQAVEEDANNLRSMLGKSLRKIDRYTEAIRRNEVPPPSTDTDGSTVDAYPRQPIDRSSEEAKYLRSSKRRTRSASHTNLKERDRTHGLSPSASQAPSSNVIVNNSEIVRDVSAPEVSAEVQSPLRRYRRARKSVN